MALNETKSQYQTFTPNEFEEFRKLVQEDGFTLTKNSIDSVEGHIGAVIYLFAEYNRNQNILNVTVKTSPWMSFPSSAVVANINRAAGRSVTAEEAGHPPVNSQQVAQVPNAGPVKVPPTATSAAPPVIPPTKVAESDKKEPEKAPETPKVEEKAAPATPPKA